MFSFIIVSTIFLFGVAARILGSIGNALNAAIGVERCEVKIPPFVEPPSVKKARRSDLNGPTNHADTIAKNKPAEPDKPSASVRAPGTANTGKPKGTFGGMKSGFLLQTPAKKKPQPKAETAAKADAPKPGQDPPEQKPKKTAGQKDPPRPAAETGQVKLNKSPRQKKEDPPRQKAEAGQEQASRPTTDGAGQSSRLQTIPIRPVFAQLTPILLPVPGTNQVSLIWDKSRKARNFLAMIVAARRAAGL